MLVYVRACFIYGTGDSVMIYLPHPNEGVGVGRDINRAENG